MFTIFSKWLVIVVVVTDSNIFFLTTDLIFKSNF